MLAGERERGRQRDRPTRSERHCCKEHEESPVETRPSFCPCANLPSLRMTSLRARMRVVISRWSHAEKPAHAHAASTAYAHARVLVRAHAVISDFLC